MKYIRVKDDCYEWITTFAEYDEARNKATELGLTYSRKIIKQADSIKKLCDEFVVFDKEQPNGKMIYYKGFETLKKEFIDFDRDKEKVVIFGAIWTDRGLKYVAKINEKGKLELL